MTWFPNWGGTRVVVFASLSYNNTDFDTNVTFRQVGIIKDPGTTAASAFAGYGIKVEDGPVTTPSVRLSPKNLR